MKAENAIGTKQQSLWISLCTIIADIRSLYLMPYSAAQKYTILQKVLGHPFKWI